MACLIRLVTHQTSQSKLLLPTTAGFASTPHGSFIHHLNRKLWPLIFWGSPCLFTDICITWWRHQMETLSPLLAICAGNSPVPGEFPTQRPVTRSFDVFFDLRLNKRLSKQWRGWWFETLSCSLWRHRYENATWHVTMTPATNWLRLVEQ